MPNLLNIKDLFIHGNSIVKLYADGNLVFQKNRIVDPLCLQAEQDNTTLTLTTSQHCTLDVSIDGMQSWQTCNPSTMTAFVLQHADDKAYFKAHGQNERVSDAYSSTSLQFDKPMKASGNIQSLLKEDCTRNDVPDNCYYNLFMNQPLTVAPELPAATVHDAGYYGMFNGTSIVDPPQLNATSIGNNAYSFMFANCNSLTAMPSLPATTLAVGCYASMFFQCQQLVDVKSLQAKTLANGCYESMFNGCTTLATAPSILADNIAADYCCKEMFANCTTLKNAPGHLYCTQLNADCYSKMFSGCTALESHPTMHAQSVGMQSCKEMFKNCISLTCDNSIVLSAGSIAQYGCDHMYESCKALQHAPAMSAASIEQYGCQYMFCNCTGLLDAPQLPAMALADYCYYCMFYGCTSLTSVPELPAATLAVGCYHSMLNGCTSLERPMQTLSSTQLEANCYYNMFLECTALTCTPELPATTLKSNCYQNMFSGCTSLVSACALPATELVDNCYAGMLVGTQLTSLTVQFTDWNASSNATDWWVQGINTTGKFYCPQQLADEHGISRIPSNWEKAIPVADDMFCFEAVDSDVTVKLVKSTATAPTVALESSTDCVSWNTNYDCYSDTTILVGTKLYLRARTTGNERFGNDGNNYNTFNFTGNGNVKCVGNIMYLLSQSPTTRIGSPCTFIYLFKDCSKLLSAPELPATELKNYCYYRMFLGCTSLAAAPQLPASILAGYCYAEMFKGCKALSAAHELSAMSLATNCYQDMFNNCINLSTAFSILPATNLSAACYKQMFYNCQKLQSAPELPAETLAKSCYYYMFYGCRSLKLVDVSFTEWNTSINSTTGWLNDTDTGTADRIFKCPAELPQTRGAGYIPSGWTIQTKAADDMFCFEAVDDAVTVKLVKSRNNAPTVTLESSTDGVNWNTAYDCYSETAVPVGTKLYLRAGTAGNNAFGTFSYSLGTKLYNYFEFANGKVKCNGNIMYLLSQSPTTSIEYDHTFIYLFIDCTTLMSAPQLPATTLASSCYSGMFYGCTSLTVAPQLPAMTLADSCYSIMFLGCTSLTTTPQLQAMALVNDCYNGMFSGCTSLTTAPQLPATTLASNCYSNMFSKCTSLTTAPQLPATTLANSCYFEMFSGCTSLKLVDVSFTEWTQTATDFWLEDTGTGTAAKIFKCPTGLPQTRGTSYIPEGWTIQTK